MGGGPIDPGEVSLFEKKTYYDFANCTAEKKFKAKQNVFHTFLDFQIAVHQLLDCDIQPSFRLGKNTMGGVGVFRRLSPKNHFKTKAEVRAPMGNLN